MCCCFRRKKKPNSASKTHTPPPNSVAQNAENMPPPQQQQSGASGIEQAIQPVAANVGNISNVKSSAACGTPTNQTPKKGKSKEGIEKPCQSMPGTVEEMKSKHKSCVSQVSVQQKQPQSMPPPSQTPLKSKTINKNQVEAIPKKSAAVSSKLKRKKPGETTISKKADGTTTKQEETEHFEEGEDKSREDISVDDTLKGVGTEMPHFES